ncbi:hypothetical protein F8A90_01735 [Cobetia sp. cqz5-12]|uniref:hypothetical protein n=1 Tax=Cobetia sp. cqz5-12 TaxID=2609415 RepID=UPI001904AA06|nr:hypothetical protein [Cobetia sp. cqz5-12]QQK62994.1 hypothetical protein F8A90_01735 [Cobetia sp. cqz5-12]
MSPSAASRIAPVRESDSASRQPPAAGAAPSRFWLASRAVQHWRHGLGVSALGLMLGSAPAYANGIEDLPVRHQLSAAELSTSGLSADGSSTTKHSNGDRAHATLGNDAGKPATDISDTASTQGLAPELLTQMMLHASRKGMLEFSTLDIRDDHVQFTGWGHNGWQMELAINLADGEFISEALRQSDSAPGSKAIDGDSMRQTLNFAAVDGIKRVQSVEVTAHAIQIHGRDAQGRPQRMALNMPLPGNAFNLAASASMNPDYRP